MVLKQYYLGCLAHASYLIADERTKVAAVVDPQRDIDQYVQEAEAHGWSIQHVFLTHFHADFLAGHLELRDRVGARIYLGAKAEAEYPFTPLRDGDAITFGDVRLKILETPGHTPEGISILVFDLAESATEPKAVLTGDTLFIGDVGRPDLLASIGVTAEELAHQLYESIHEKILPLPDRTLVYPAHGAGSLCGKQLSQERVSTLGEQKKYNSALQPMSREAFVRLVTADQPDTPEYFAFDAVRNRSERPVLEESMKRAAWPLTVDELLRLQEQGASVLDARAAADFEGAHLIGSINIGLKGQYATWCGTVLSHEAPIVIVAEPGDEAEAIMRLGRIGFDNVAGYLEGGMAALADRPDRIGATRRITAPALAEQLDGPNPPTVLDVRTPSEHAGGRIEGSWNIPLNRLVARLDELPTDRPLVVHCQGGYRSSIACSLLKQHGADPTDLVGGYKAWVASKLPTTEPAAT